MNAGKDDGDPSRSDKSSQSSAGFERYVSITMIGSTAETSLWARARLPFAMATMPITCG
jgi:hypothetical protein